MAEPIAEQRNDSTLAAKNAVVAANKDRVARVGARRRADVVGLERFNKTTIRSGYRIC